jgi:prepilin-type N-terminal cleavage/methylation domain-containing protein
MRQFLASGNYRILRKLGIMSGQRGYTIIELLIVIVLLASISITATTLLFTSLGGSGKASGLAVVKQSGDQAIQLIERQIRGAGSVSCPAVNQLTITDSDGITATFEIVNDVAAGVDRVAYSGPVFITSDELSASNFSCSLISTGIQGEPDVVEVQFTLAIAPGGRPSEAVTETFRTRTSLRNY